MTNFGYGDGKGIYDEGSGRCLEESQNCIMLIVNELVYAQMM